MTDAGRWGIAVFLGLVALFCILAAPVLQLVQINRNLRSGSATSVSGVWLIGSIAGTVALLVCPAVQGRLRWLALAPLAVETAVFAASMAYWRLSGMESRWRSLRAKETDVHSE